jgi:hypothetical protein
LEETDYQYSIFKQCNLAFFLENDILTSNFIFDIEHERKGGEKGVQKFPPFFAFLHKPLNKVIYFPFLCGMDVSTLFIFLEKTKEASNSKVKIFLS